MTDRRTLGDLVELAAKRRETSSGRRLAEIAQANGHEISHSTVNRIRKGNYTSEPTSEILRAIAFLSKEPEAEVFAVAAETHDWGELEAAFDVWNQVRERLLLLTDRYARLRGITVSVASVELNDMAQQMVEFRAGRGGWYPPWDPESPAQRHADQVAATEDGDSDGLPIPIRPDTVWPPARAMVSRIDTELRGNLRSESMEMYADGLADRTLDLGTQQGVEGYMGVAVAAAGDSGFEAKVFSLMLAEAPDELAPAARQFAQEYFRPGESDKVGEESQESGHEAAGA